MNIWRKYWALKNKLSSSDTSHDFSKNIVKNGFGHRELSAHTKYLQHNITQSVSSSNAGLEENNCLVSSSAGEKRNLKQIYTKVKETFPSDLFFFFLPVIFIAAK